jgi:hypothetical protein
MFGRTPQFQRLRRCLGLLGSFSLVAGCYSGLEASGLDSGAGSAGQHDTNGADDGGSGDDSGDPAASCADPSVGETPLRRLTRLEYDNTVRDLLGVTSAIAQTRFSPDEKVAGYSANALAPISSTQLDQYARAAEDLSALAFEDGAQWIGCDPADDTCASSFVADFGRRAFRRPLDPDERSDYLALYQQGRASWDGVTGLRLVVQAMLLSPHFLYHVETLPPEATTSAVPLDGYEVASRLSYFLWSSMPDDVLFAAAETGALLDPDELETQARRMLDDPRARDTLASFHRQWLHVEGLRDQVKDFDLFPGWTEELAEAAEAETIAFVDEVISRGDARLQTLLTADWTIGDAQLAALYGAEAPTDGLDGVLQLDASQRAGLMTQIAFLASKAHAAQSSWVERGLFVREYLLCQPLPAPPPGVEVNDANDPARLEDPECSACHILIDPIGRGFDNYDAVGAFVTQDAEGNPLEVQGEVVGVPSVGTFENAVSLATALADAPEVHDCMAQQWFTFFSRRPVSKNDACSIEEVQATFAESGQDVRELIVAIVRSDAFRHRSADEGLE